MKQDTAQKTIKDLNCFCCLRRGKWISIKKHNKKRKEKRNVISIMDLALCYLPFLFVFVFLCGAIKNTTVAIIIK